MSILRSILLTLVLSVLAGAVGAWGGVRYVEAHARNPPSLHQLLHERLSLTADQQQRIEALERDHEARRKALETEMRASNAELAQAYQQAHAYTPRVEGAIDRFHRAMGALQTETLQHIFAMRAVLTPAQAARFDDTVVRSLTAQDS
ncbi:MAG TPA: periplasmic heavy metal sensor [Caulobacteraceae bacterium]